MAEAGSAAGGTMAVSPWVDPLRSISATCAAVGRAAGSIAVIAASSCGHGAGSSGGMCGARLSRAAIASSIGPSKQRCPVSDSISTRPSEYTSAGAPTSPPRACSGAT